MELQQLNGYGAFVGLDPVDCAALARICQEAEDNLMSLKDTHLLTFARTFGAFCRALAVAGLAPGYLSRNEKSQLIGDLASLGLGELAAPLLPEGGKQ